MPETSLSDLETVMGQLEHIRYEDYDIITPAAVKERLEIFELASRALHREVSRLSSALQKTKMIPQKHAIFFTLTHLSYDLSTLHYQVEDLTGK